MNVSLRPSFQETMQSYVGENRFICSIEKSYVRDKKEALVQMPWPQRVFNAVAGAIAIVATLGLALASESLRSRVGAALSKSFIYVSRGDQPCLRARCAQRVSGMKRIGNAALCAFAFLGSCGVLACQRSFQSKLGEALSGFKYVKVVVKGEAFAHCMAAKIPERPKPPIEKIQSIQEAILPEPSFVQKGLKKGARAWEWMRMFSPIPGEI